METLPQAVITAKTSNPAVRVLVLQTRSELRLQLLTICPAVSTGCANNVPVLMVQAVSGLCVTTGTPMCVCSIILRCSQLACYACSGATAIRYQHSLT